ncbi:MAG: sigma-70 family RNA polymerase sigma factor [Lutispora sp.]|nr:sigma-70 family RNA polymerase sigma factor [Lutispora sp.]
MKTDESLYKSYINGEDACLSLLMERYGDRLTFYINGYLHDLHDAEDLMIESFAYLIVKKPSIKEGCFKAYLYKIARNLSLRSLDKKHRQRDFSFQDVEDEPDKKMFIEEIIQEKERYNSLHLCMEGLNSDYREALYLVYFEDMHHAEVGRIMKKSEKQVADLVYRGRKSLRKRLEREGITNADY